MNRVIYLLFLTLCIPLFSYEALNLELDNLKKYLKQNPKDYKIYVLMSRYYLNHNDYNQSAIYINQANQIDANATEVLELKKEIQEYRSNRNLLKKYNLNATSSENSFFYRLEKLKEKGKYEEFELLLDYLIRTHPNLEKRFFLSASELMLERKQLYKSRSLLQRCTQLKEQKPYLKIEVKLCELESEFLCSAQAYEKLYAISQNHQEQLLAAKMYMLVDNYQKASPLLGKTPKSLRTSKLYQELSSKLRTYQEHNILLLKKEYTSNPNFHNLKKLCNALHEYDRYQEASLYLQKHIKLFGATQELKKYAGDMAYWNSDTEKAIFYYSKIKKQDTQIQYKLGRLFSWQGSYTKALKALDSAQNLDTEGEYYYKIYKARAFIWLWSAQYAKAVDTFEILLKNTPDDEELQKAYKNAKAHRDGKIATKKVRKSASSLKSFELQKAMTYYENSNYLQSLGYFSYYLSKHADDFQAREKYAFALEKSAKHLQASQEYQELYKLTDKKKFLHHSAYNLLKAEKFTKAEKLYAQLIGLYGSNEPDKIDVKATSKDILMEYAYLLEKNAKFNEAKLLYETMLHDYAAVRNITNTETDFLHSWQGSWEKRSIDGYMSHYTPKSERWKLLKKKLFRDSVFIDVNITAPRVISADIYRPLEIFTLRFLQHYQSKIVTDIGFKELDITCNAISCLIKNERWSKIDIDAQKNSMKKYALEHLKYLETIRAKREVQSLATERKKVEKKTLVKETKTSIKASRPKSDFIAKSLHKNALASKSPSQNRPSQESLGSYNLGVHVRNFSDSDKRHYVSGMIKGGYDFNKNSALNGGIGVFTLEEKFRENNGTKSEKVEGNTFMLEFVSNAWTFGSYFDHYLGKTDFSPYLIYNLSLSSNFVEYSQLKHYLQFKIYKRNLFISKLSIGAMYDRIDKYAFKVSDYMEFNNHSSLWFAFDAGYITDNNHIVNFMFDYEMYKNKYKKLDYHLILSGWYEHNKEEKIQYYSPDFDDLTQVLTRLYYPLNGYINIKAMGGIGRNFNYKKNILRYGLWLETSRKTKTKFELGCLRSQVLNSPIEVDTLGYDFYDCKLDYHYYW